MSDLLQGLEFWHWWVFAGALVVVETLLPSGVLYGVAAAAFLVGVALAANMELMTSNWLVQVGVGLVLAVFLGAAARVIRDRRLAPPPPLPDPPAAGRSAKPNPLGEPAATDKPLDLAKPAARRRPRPAATRAQSAMAKARRRPPAAGLPPSGPPTAGPAKADGGKRPAAGDLVGGPALGSIYTIWTPIENGKSALKIKGTEYAISGPDLPAGSRIKITAVDGTTLKVEAAD